MSVKDLKRGYSVRLGSGQPEFDSLQVLSGYIFFYIFIIGGPKKNYFQIILDTFIFTIISLMFNHVQILVGNY